MSTVDEILYVVMRICVGALGLCLVWLGILLAKYVWEMP